MDGECAALMNVQDITTSGGAYLGSGVKFHQLASIESFPESFRLIYTMNIFAKFCEIQRKNDIAVKYLVVKKILALYFSHLTYLT